MNDKQLNQIIDDVLDDAGYYSDDERRPAMFDIIYAASKQVMHNLQSEIEAVRAEKRELREAAKKLSFAAQISGGTAGRDEFLQEGIDAVEQALSSTSTAPTEAYCPYCDNEREIETDNNGPIGPCPICRPERKTEAEIRAQRDREIADWLEGYKSNVNPLRIANELRQSAVRGGDV